MRGDGVIRYALRLARKSCFLGRREYVPVGCGKNVRVFHAPGNNFCDRSAAWVAAGLFAWALSVYGAPAMAAVQPPEAGQSPARGQPSPQEELGQLMQLLARRRHGEVRYVEKDYLAVLERPLRSSGVMIYDAPDHLEKRTLQPKPESLVLDHGELTIQRGHRTYHLALSSYPQVAPYVDAIRATMAGDLEALERVFKVSFSGDLKHWQLALAPLDKKIAHGVRTIRIAGAEQEVQSVEIDKPNGDRSVMTMGAPAPEGSPTQ
jgi:hypothetical protein